MGIKKKQIPMSLYYELCKTLAELEEAPDNELKVGYKSDGEWLDIFISLCEKLKNEMDK